MANEKPLDKEQVWNYGLLFLISKSAVARVLHCNTNKTDRIVFNSLLKAVDKRKAAEQEND